MQKKLKKILSLLAMLIVCFGSLPIAAPAAVRAEMSSEDVIRETQEYMAQNNIHFESASYGFTESEGRRVYTVSSQDSTVFQGDNPFQKTVSVMNVKAADGTGGIYVAEAAYRQGAVSYNLKLGGETVASAKINVSVPVGPVQPPIGPGPCDGDMTQAEINQRLADALARANATCQMQMTTYQYNCAIYCFVRVYPNSPRCRWILWEDVAVQAVIRGHIETYAIP